jgi:hypothetical protein
VRVTPRGGRDAIDGLAKDASGKPILKARVAAAPADGKANSALVSLLAKAFDAPGSAVTILRGASARVKEVHVGGDGARLAARLKAMGETG